VGQVVMTVVYLLWHVHEDEPDSDNDKLCGIYSTEANAKEAIERLLKQPGFRDFPTGFQIAKYTIDKNEWTEGFVSTSGGS